MSATSAAICCSSATKRLRLCTSECIAALLAIASLSEASTPCSSSLLCENAAARPRSSPWPEARRVWSSLSTMPAKRCVKAATADSICWREFSMCAAQTGSTSWPNWSALARNAALACRSRVSRARRARSSSAPATTIAAATSALAMPRLAAQAAPPATSANAVDCQRCRKAVAPGAMASDGAYVVVGMGWFSTKDSRAEARRAVVVDDGFFVAVTDSIA